MFRVLVRMRFEREREEKERAMARVCIYLKVRNRRVIRERNIISWFYKEKRR